MKHFSILTRKYPRALFAVLIFLPVNLWALDDAEDAFLVQSEDEVTQAKGRDSVYHLSGYAAASYVSNEGGDDAFTGLSFNPIFHFLYKELILFEGELELEIEEDGETEVALEYATIDIFLHDYVALIAGKFISPLGQFVQNIHPAWINKLPSNPVGFSGEQAAPQAEVGVQLRGGLPLPRSMKMNYALYVGNGPRAEMEEGRLDSIETDGFASDEGGKKVWGGRIGFLPIPALELGLSGAIGEVGLFEDGELVESDLDYNVVGVDGSYQWRRFSFRGEYSRQYLGSSSEFDSGTWEAWYIQSSYQLPWNRWPEWEEWAKWEFVLRYGEFYSPNECQEQNQVAFGLNYLIAPNAIAKVAYEVNWNGDNDSDRFLMQLAYGF